MNPRADDLSARAKRSHGGGRRLRAGRWSVFTAHGPHRRDCNSIGLRTALLPFVTEGLFVLGQKHTTRHTTQKET
jgi:hypothetical protein